MLLCEGGVLMGEILQAISNYGFPMVVSACLLLRLEGRMEQLTQSLQELIRILDAQRISK